MADTAATLISDALGEILVSAAEQPVEAAQMSGAIRVLNRMMAAWSSAGIALGYTAITGPSDAITVPDGALDGLVTNLAVRLAPQYDESVTPELLKAANDGMKAIRQIAVTTTRTPYPCTLPVGSGNEWDIAGSVTDKFYPCTTDTVLTEEGGNIQLENDTNA